ncbi:hypothetical protein D7W81_06880 [Corallococcus aberystwythensis]|uniref:Uncharacterized protein n=1 Tax=Corallococcus aberystwythensis TaxID=2316722 RepID=A0A3A8QZC6_9BACT|nr:hypothetical protein D7W81_06880 [Corallococcus aberystwythensis]
MGLRPSCSRSSTADRACSAHSFSTDSTDRFVSSSSIARAPATTTATSAARTPGSTDSAPVHSAGCVRQVFVTES